MTTRYAKSILSLAAALAASLAFVASATAAPPAGLSWEVHGTGNTGAVTVLMGGMSRGPAMPQHVGNATYELTLFPPLQVVSNGAGGFCSFVTGSGSVTAADGSTIPFATVGILCNEANEGGTSPVHYNGTYRITDGTRRFVGVAGGGSLTATFGSSTSPTHFFKIDGTITGI
jgi:hypothetical protein